MKTQKIVSLLLVLLLAMSMLAGCGASSDAVANSKTMAAYDMAAPAEMKEAAAAAPMAQAEGSALTTSDTGGSTALPESRKWIITMDIFAETEDLDSMMAALDEKIAALKGYVEGQNIHNGSSYSERRYRSAYLTVRIPAEDVDSFTEEISGIANVVSCNKNLEDVTLSYVATESRVAALETEQERLLELMEQAETMADLLEIEARLTDVRYELESVTSQLRTYDNQINYATIYLNIEEVQEYTPVEEPTLWERISGGFSDSIEGLGESLQDILVWLVVSSPFLLVYGGIVVVIIVLVTKLRKRKGTKKEKAKKQPWQTPAPENDPEEK